MNSNTELPHTVQEELARRHKAAATTVLGLLVATVLLCIVAFLSRKFLVLRDNPSLDIAVKITIVIFGLGAIALRRTRFSTMRLQDIGGLGGAHALLKTFEKTTLQVALIGAALTVIGFTGTLLTGDPFYTYRAGLIAIVILLYCYPTRTSWQRTILRFAGTDIEAKPSTLASE